MKLLQPVVRIRNQEALHLVTAEVEDVGTPIGMPAQLRILMLVQCGSVEALQRPRVSRKVPRHPVHHDADPCLMKLVDQVAELIGGAEL